MKYEEAGKEILEQVGGRKNVDTVTHCLTRLRVTAKDPSKVNASEIEQNQLVKKVIQRGTNFQIVIGEEVDDVYDAFLNQMNEFPDDQEVNKEEVTNQNKTESKKPNIFVRAIDAISGCLVPILPALIASGLLSGVLSLVTAVGWVDSASSTYTILSAFSSAPLYFLPFLLAYSSATRLKVNPSITLGIAAITLFPQLTTLFSSEEAITFFSIPVKTVTYSQNIIPILLIVWVQSLIEPKLSKAIPNYLKTLFLPLIEYTILGVLMLLIIGPIAGLLNDGLYYVINTLSQHFSWLIVSLLGGFNAIRIGAGLNHSVLPIAVANFSALGYDNIVGPAMFVTTFSLSGTCFGLMAKSKDSTIKGTAISAGFTALMGISEPAVFSVMLTNKRSLVATTIAGLISGFFMGLTHVQVNALGTKGLPGIALLIGPTFTVGIIGCILAFVLGFILSYVFGEDKK
ncbi:TPA: PTS transporter subunit EIIC [Enterococcus faecium]|nr:PTS transporter subunit EIIC [Enterococcus faecium]